MINLSIEVWHFLKQKMIILFLIIFTFLINDCTVESPLSDIDINDPSIIKPVIFVNKNITPNSIIYTIATWLYDKNENSIELKSGKIKLNGIDMRLKRGFNDAPYYTIEPFDILPFKLNTTYESSILLSDGKAYISSVTTREKDLYQLNVPEEHNKNEDIYLSWKDAVNDMELVLTMILTGSSDSVNHVDVYKFNISNPLSGNFTISKNYFINNPEINKAQFTLEAIYEGKISKSFMKGSKITSTISMTRFVNLK